MIWLLIVISPILVLLVPFARGFIRGFSRGLASRDDRLAWRYLRRLERLERDTARKIRRRGWS